MIPLKDGKGYALVRAEAGLPAGATLYLYDVIGPDYWSGGGLTAKQVIEDLKALGDVADLAVRINSPGGDVFDGIAIYNALARYSGKVTVHVDGLAASIASVIAMAGDTVKIAENAMMMVHEPWTVAMGNASDMRTVAETLDKSWSALLTTYARRTGRRAEKIAQNVVDAGGEWWMTAEEAVAAKFADEATKPEKAAPQAYGLHRFARVPERLAAALKEAAPPAHPRLPTVAEIAAPRVVVAPRETGTSAAQRRRAFEVLRLSS